jgi:hypothetical protein
MLGPFSQFRNTFCMFLLILSFFNIYRCVVVEDSTIGLAAAKAAGMTCIITKSGCEFSFLIGNTGIKTLYLSFLFCFLFLLVDNKARTEKGIPSIHFYLTLFFKLTNVKYMKNRGSTLFQPFTLIGYTCYQLHCRRGLLDSRCCVRLHRWPTRSAIWFGLLCEPAPETIPKLKRAYTSDKYCFIHTNLFQEISFRPVGLIQSISN